MSFSVVNGKLDTPVNHHPLALACVSVTLLQRKHLSRLAERREIRIRMDSAQ